MPLRAMAWNCENLFYFSEEGENPNKSEQKLKTLAKNINFHEVDIVFLAEVGGLKSLENFNQDFLASKFICSLIPGNSDRNIHQGVLLKKNAKFYGKHRSYRELKLSNSTFFCRDVVELQLYQNKNKNRPFLTFFFVHLKSQWDRSGLDFKGKKQRAAEVLGLVKILNSYREKNPNSPFILWGDFNGRPNAIDGDEEFSPLFHHLTSHLSNLFDCLNLEKEERASSVFFDITHKYHQAELDHCFISPELEAYLDKKNCGIAPIMSDELNPLPFPNSPQQKMSYCSDHRPIILTLNGPMP